MVGLRSVAALATVASASAGASSCTLLSQESKKPCIHDSTFGCYSHGRSMWTSEGCRGDFTCGDAQVHCGATGMYASNFKVRNCTCVLREQTWLGPLGSDLTSVRLPSKGVVYGDPGGRFVPTNFAEALHGTFALWDVLDRLMHEHEPKQLYATGYMRELQLRRTIELARDPSVEHYCEVGMNGGHSTVAMLLANPRMTAHVFDMMMWGYSNPIAKLLKTRFGHRFQLHPGSSHETLKPWASAFSANGSKCNLLFVDGDHTEAGAHMDVQDLLPTVSVDSRLIMDDISVGPGCVMKRFARRGVLRIEETFGPFDAPSPHNPCMRSSAAGRSETCATWGFAILRYTEKGIANPKAWPLPKRPGANRGKRCWEVEAARAGLLLQG